MIRRILPTAAFASIVGVASGSALGQPAPAAPSPEAPLRVGISPFPPFVIDEPQPKGFSIDLWRQVAAKIDRPYEFVSCTGAADKLDRLQADEIDVAIGGLTTSAERETKVDFTHPTYRAGLGIMLPGAGTPPGLWDRVTGALEKANTTVVAAFFVMVFIAGHLVWFIERGRDTFNDRYLPGVFEGVYWAVVTASTVGYGDKAPIKYAGRILAMLVIVVSLPMFALFTAELASAFTLQSIAAAISGPEDLQGRRVGVIRGTSSAKFAAGRGLELRQWEQADDMYQGLLDRRVSAVIYDAPSLNYFAQTTGADRVHILKRTFDVRDLAMATQQGSEVREHINRALLDLEAEGTLGELRIKWFGSDD